VNRHIRINQWKQGVTPVAASLVVADERNFNIVLDIGIRIIDSLTVAKFVAKSLSENGIRYWEDDNGFGSGTPEPYNCFAIAGSNILYYSDLAKIIKIKRTADGITVNIPCFGM
jgi:hypothetical protein